MTETDAQRDVSPSRPKRWQVRHRGLLAGVALAALVVGAAAGAGGLRVAQNWQPRSVLLLQPTAIDRLQPGGPSAVRGNVTEIFGHMFVVEDSSGRALIDLGPRGEHQNRRGNLFRPHAIEHGKAILPRQHDIKHNKVIALDLEGVFRARAGFLPIDGIAQPLKAGDNSLAYVLGILDDQYAHGAPDDSKMTGLEYMDGSNTCQGQGQAAQDGCSTD